jgi:hypothetical protein
MREREIMLLVILFFLLTSTASATFTIEKVSDCGYSYRITLTGEDYQKAVAAASRSLPPIGGGIFSAVQSDTYAIAISDWVANTYYHYMDYENAETAAEFVLYAMTRSKTLLDIKTLGLSLLGDEAVKFGIAWKAHEVISQAVQTFPPDLYQGVYIDVMTSCCDPFWCPADWTIHQVNCPSGCWIESGSCMCPAQPAQPAQPSRYPRTNEYWDTSQAPCTPGSIHAMCDTPNSCVDCKGGCYSEGRHPTQRGGYATCSQGKWIYEESTPKPQQPKCPAGCWIESGSCICPAQPVQPKQPSCEGGKVWNPSAGVCTYPGQDFLRTNEYCPGSSPKTCMPGSQQAWCKSPNSCVDCKGQCYSEGQYKSSE